MQRREEISVHFEGEGFSTLQEKFSVHCSWEITAQCSAEGEYSAGGRLYCTVQYGNSTVKGRASLKLETTSWF